MIPDTIVRYLQENRIPFTRRWHPRAVPAQELAAAMHVSGYRVCKTVVADVDGRIWLCVLPAPEMLDEQLVAEELDANRVRMADESSFGLLFAGCEVGAEPPFGRLYGLPVIADRRLARPGENIVLRAGSHEETIEMRWEDFLRLEQPRLGEIGRIFRVPRPAVQMQPQLGI